MQKFFVDVPQDLVYSYGWTSRLVRPIWNVKRAPKPHTPHFDDFRVHTILWVIRIPTSKMPNFFMDVRQYLVYAYDLLSRFVRPIWKVKRAQSEHTPYFDDFRVLIAHHFLSDPDSDVKNAKFFHGRPSRPCLCIRLAITDCPGYFKGQTSPEASIRLISTIFVCYNTPFFG